VIFCRVEICEGGYYKVVVASNIITVYVFIRFLLRNRCNTTHSEQFPLCLRAHTAVVCLPFSVTQSHSMRNVITETVKIIFQGGERKDHDYNCGLPRFNCGVPRFNCEGFRRPDSDILTL
jgi:hypothetical protein